MKNLAILVIGFVGFFNSAAQKTEPCFLYINSKPFGNTGTISKYDLALLSTLEVKHARLDYKLTPVSFEWMIHSKGQIWKGNTTTLAKLKEIAPKLKTGDIIFIDRLMFKGITGVCEGQFAFTLE